MYKDKDEGDGIIALVRETVDGIGHLVAEHVKLARLELVAEAKDGGRRLALIALIVPIVFIGYALVCIGLSLLLARWLGSSNAFFLVGGVHVVLGGVAVTMAAARLRRAQPLRETVQEVGRSVEVIATVGAPVTTNGTSAPQAPARGL
jgi:uncharacterized membrane protein YqjE